MIKKLYLFFIASLILIIFVSAADSIGQRQDAQVDKIYYISQPCATCSYINISVYTKEGIVLDNVAMINNGTSWIYPFIPTEALRYDVNGVGDKGGVSDSFAFWFDATLSGEQTNTPIIISDIVLLIAILGILMFMFYQHKSTDFEGWNKNILNKNKHTGQLLVRGFIYTIFKNSYIWIYFTIWLFILVLKDVVYRFNSSEIYNYFTLMANIYSLGLLLVLIFIIGHFITFIKNSVDSLSDKEWGVGEE